MLLRFHGLLLLVSFLQGTSGREAVYNIDTTGGLGRRFDGIGGLSAGASSKLLVNYPQRQRDEILDFLFKPDFGASLHMLKVEIGGDAQSTDGTEATHMRSAVDENYFRGYEWWLMKEAKKRNPDIKLYGLPWGFPGWVGNNTENPYTDPLQLATYVTSWIRGVKIVHDLDIDYVGIWNERMYNITYVKTLRQQLDAKGFTETKIIAADYFGWDISKDIMKDTKFANAIYGIGVHYPGTNSAMEALQTGKPLWSSEDYSSDDDVIGGGCWARLLNRNYVNGFMTSTISWALIASWYDGLPYSGAGLMTANEPWSGHYEVATPIWASAHTAQFTKPGWRYLRHGSGVGNLENGGTYVSFVSPDEQDLTIVIETMSHDMSVCIRPPLPPYNVSTQTIVFDLKNSGIEAKNLYVWYSKFSKNQTSVKTFVQMPQVPVLNYTVSLELGVDEIWTLTTLNTGHKGETEIPPSKPFPLPYKDDFEKYYLFSEPYNLSPQMGSFEIAATYTDSNRYVSQMSVAPPVKWCNADTLSRSLAIIGSAQWTNVNVSVRFSLDMGGNSSGIYIGARINQTGCQSNEAGGVFLVMYPSNKTYQLNSDISGRETLYSGELVNVLTGWNTVELSVNGEQISGAFNQKKLFETTAATLVQSGFVGLGTTTLGHAYFDDLEINLPKRNFNLNINFTVVL